MFSIPGAHHLGTSYPQLDLAVLSLCDHLVIDFGTFGLWVSYRLSDASPPDRCSSGRLPGRRGRDPPGLRRGEVRQGGQAAQLDGHRQLSQSLHSQLIGHLIFIFISKEATNQAQGPRTKLCPGSYGQ